MPNKEYIPHTNPDWNLELPEGYTNSLVDKHGRIHENGYNFDEKDQTNKEENIPEFDPEAAKKARESVEKNRDCNEAA